MTFPLPQRFDDGSIHAAEICLKGVSARPALRASRANLASPSFVRCRGRSACDRSSARAWLRNP